MSPARTSPPEIPTLAAVRAAEARFSNGQRYGPAERALTRVFRLFPANSRSYTVHQWGATAEVGGVGATAVSDDNVRLTVEVTSGTGKVLAFRSSVANGSQDPSTFEMASADDLLASNASGLEWPPDEARWALEGEHDAGVRAVDLVNRHHAVSGRRVVQVDAIFREPGAGQVSPHLS